jgi:diaminohydroxyphosphoribosylaminopyrimidine deaminase/5-amino-6-(5-phosphoribosylamino)uracil reductase
MSGVAPRDIAWMDRAIELSRNGWGQTLPNPLVGAVIVANGQVVGEGFHSRFGEAHAEVEAIRQAGELARGATLYVTLEPCTHSGMTPPCCSAIVTAGLRRVVYANADPHPEAGGGAIELASSGLDVSGGVQSYQAAQVNAAFFWQHLRPAAYVGLKLAVSLDGRIAEREGVRTDLTGTEARRDVMRLRAAHDAILVGSGTVRVDDPLLTVRDIPAPRVPPLRVVLDSEACLPLGSRLVGTIAEAPVLALVGEHADPDRVAALRDAGVEVEMIGRDSGRGLNLSVALDVLKDRGRSVLLCEGGAGLATSLLSGGHVQRIHWFVAPRVLGPGGVAAVEERILERGAWSLADCRSLGDDVLIEWNHTSLEAVMKEI